MAENTLSEILSKLNPDAQSAYWAARIINELRYAKKLSIDDCRIDAAAVQKSCDYIMKTFEAEGAVTKRTALKAESMLEPIAAAAKKYTINCCAHAHIDMNWQWSFDETVSITLDTFRTMLDLMQEYKDFKFSQSQASVYKIVEEYDPAMLREIKKRVREGRWEITASTWVEGDKNMPSGESQARQLLYTRRYLSELFDIPGESLNIDFEPDTFGHSANVPEILSEAGVKYYYQCRGYEGREIAYRWMAPSGAEILVYHEPTWYLGPINYDLGVYASNYCAKTGGNMALEVYGVGDHGGGPTRRDLERLIDMDRWPIYPNIRFGTFADFFASLEKQRSKLPVVKGELNVIFDGCYTTQSRIKMGNKMSENMLFEAEAFSALTGNKGCKPARFEDAWRNVLFNQFHDIIPGSGVTATREYAMAGYQTTMAIANTERTRAFRGVAAQIDTSAFLPDEDISDTTSEGAGVGNGIMDFKVTQRSGTAGRTRAFTLFNPLPFERTEPVELTVWDYPLPPERISFIDSEGTPAPSQVLNNGHKDGHAFIAVLVEAHVPSMGYTTVILTPNEEPEKNPALMYPRGDTQSAMHRALENDQVRVKFDEKNGSLDSFKWKADNTEYLPEGGPDSCLRVVEEDGSRGMTAWVVGKYSNVYPLLENVDHIHPYGGPLQNGVMYDCTYKASKIHVNMYLRKGSPFLYYDVYADWREFGDHTKTVPQLQYYTSYAYKEGKNICDIPFGAIERSGNRLDVPALNYLTNRSGETDRSLMIMTRSKYGYRSHGKDMSLTLIRSSDDPDAWPEIGGHKISFALGLVPSAGDAADYASVAAAYNHPMSAVTCKKHSGDRPASGSLLKLSGCVLSTVKQAEDSSALIVRLYEARGRKSEVALTMPGAIEGAVFCDLHEQPTDGELSIDGDAVYFTAMPNKVYTLKIVLKA